MHLHKYLKRFRVQASKDQQCKLFAPVLCLSAWNELECCMYAVAEKAQEKKNQ